MQMFESTAAPGGVAPNLTPLSIVETRQLAGAIAQLDAILERDTVRFIQLDRAQLIDRIGRVREAALAARMLLTDQRPVWWES
jgi:hypothetical protein